MLQPCTNPNCSVQFAIGISHCPACGTLAGSSSNESESSAKPEDQIPAYRDVGQLQFSARAAQFKDGVAAWRQVFTVPGHEGPMARRLSRIAWAAWYIFCGIVLGVVTILSPHFWSGAPSEFSTKSALLGGAGVFLISFRAARRTLNMRAREIPKDDRRAPVLFLRSFCDDNQQIGLTHATFGSLRRPITLEEIVDHEFSLAGPVITIGQPGEKDPPEGAARLWLDHAQWQKAVDILVDEAQLVVMLMGRLDRQPGLAWELERTAAHPDFSSKMVLVMPPVSEDEARTRWACYRDRLASKLPRDYPSGLMFVQPGIGEACQVVRAENFFGISDRRWSCYLDGMPHRVKVDIPHDLRSKVPWALNANLAACAITVVMAAMIIFCVALVLGPIHFERALKTLESNESSSARAAAVDVIQNRWNRDERAIPALIRALSDDPEYILPRVAEAAAEALAKIGPPAKEAIPVFVRRIEDSRTAPSEPFVKALASMGEPGAEELRRMLTEQKVHGETLACIAETLGQLGPAAENAVPALAKCLRYHQGAMMGDDLKVRQASIKALRKIGNANQPILPALVQILDDQEAPYLSPYESSFSDSRRDKGPTVGQQAATILLEAGPVGFELLAKALSNPNRTIRWQAAQILKSVHSPLIGEADRIVIDINLIDTNEEPSSDQKPLYGSEFPSLLKESAYASKYRSLLTRLNAVESGKNVAAATLVDDRTNPVGLASRVQSDIDVALRHMGPDLVPAICRAYGQGLFKANSEVRKEIRALAHEISPGDSSAALPERDRLLLELLHLHRDDYMPVKLEAFRNVLSGLERLGPQAAPSVPILLLLSDEYTFRDAAPEIRRTLIAMGRDAIPALTSAMDSFQKCRTLAADVLNEIGDAKVPDRGR